MITKYNWINAGILLTAIVDIIFLNIYIIQKVTKIEKGGGTQPINDSTIKVWLIICSIVLVILAAVKLIVFLTDKSPKKEQ